ncbi:hypothetical protein HYZ70_02655, partial [Candidatus Curtissbacteria bacterium]|nr:hypothetical protein [Candidatus Curtissbacteria bacterium]
EELWFLNFAPSRIVQGILDRIGGLLSQISLSPLPTPKGTTPPYIYVPPPTPPLGVFPTPPPTPRVDEILVAFPGGNYNFFLTADDLRESISKDIKEGKVKTGQLVWVCNWLNTGIDFLGIKLAARTCGLISIPNP